MKSEKEVSLHGQLVVVLASMPEDRARPDVDHVLSDRPGNDWIETEEALLSVVRAILSAGGRVVLQGDATSALVAAIAAGEYVEVQQAEGRERAPAPLIVLPHDDSDAVSLGQLTSFGIVEVARTAESQAAFATYSREALALVCIGSTSVADLIRSFRLANDKAPIFAFVMSGGAAGRLTGQELRVGRDERPVTISFIDIEATEFRPSPTVPSRTDPAAATDRLSEFAYPPFAFAAQLMVERLAGRASDESR